MFLELGLLGPDFWQRLVGRALVGAGAKTGPRQLGHLGHDVGVLLRHLGIERRAAIGHGAQASEMLAHHEQRALAVFDGVFGFGKLGGGGGGQGQGRSRQGQRSKCFHRNFLFRGWNRMVPSKPAQYAGLGAVVLWRGGYSPGRPVAQCRWHLRPHHSGAKP